jgi:hypothetical protein
MKLTNEELELLTTEDGGMIRASLGHIGIRALATEVLETRALLAFFDEDRLEEIITDSIDLDWTPRTAARAIVRAMKGAETTPPEAK